MAIATAKGGVTATAKTTSNETTAVATRNRWYPTTEQMRDPSAMERTFRRVLQLHYDLTNKYNALASDHAALSSAHSALQSQTQQSPPPGSGPTDTMLLGLHVAPVDTQSLTNGATLKFVKASGNFEFS